MSQMPEKPIIGLNGAYNTSNYNHQDFPDINGYTPICLCGQGAYGRVWLVEDLAGRTLALKVVYKSALGGDWEREYNGLITFQRRVQKHQNLIEIYHIEDRPDFFYYTMECADNMGSVDSYVPSTMANWIARFGRIGPDSLLAATQQLLYGISHLHASGIVHRDIKPDNIIFVDRVPKLSDIGLVSSVTQSLSMVGTHWFFPPEMLMSGEMFYKGINTAQLDLYALGKTMYCGLTGNAPEQFPSVPKELLTEQNSKKINKIIKWACHSNPVFRYNSAVDFCQALDNKNHIQNVIKSFLSFFYEIYRSIKNACIETFFSSATWKIVLPILLLGTILFSAPYAYKYYLYKKSLSPGAKPEYAEKYKALCEEDYRKAVPSIKEEALRKFKASLGTEDLKGYPQKIDLFRNNFDSAKLWTKQGKFKNTIIENDKIIVKTKDDLEMVLKGFLLPKSYEISFEINPSSFDGIFEITVGNQDFKLEQNPEAFKWGLGSKSKVSDLSFRYLPGKYCNFISSSTPKIKQLSPLNQFSKIQIICFNDAIRIYCNGNLVFAPSPMLFAGGFFKFKVKSEKSYSSFTLRNLHIYDLTHPPDKSKIHKIHTVRLGIGRIKIKDGNVMFSYPTPEPALAGKLPFQISYLPVEKTGEQDTYNWKYFASHEWTRLLDGKGRYPKNKGTIITKPLPPDFGLFFFSFKKNDYEYRIINKKIEDLRALRYHHVINAYPYISLIKKGDMIKLYYCPSEGKQYLLSQAEATGNATCMKLISIKGNIRIYKIRISPRKSGIYYYRDYYNEGLLLESYNNLYFENPFVVGIGKIGMIRAEQVQPKEIPVWVDVEKEIDDTLKYLNTQWSNGNTSDNMLKMKSASFYISQKTGYPEKYLLYAMKEKYGQKAYDDLSKIISNSN